ncbi:hypothetical protein GCM10007880_65820 [Mesorhizobium amorphae]|nr:hypothetical protein GCM10007880_65820 [Mesorhizobium amorphae]
MRKEGVTGLDQFGPQLRVIVYAAVENDGQPQEGVAHRLRGFLRQINDRQASMSQGNGPLGKESASVRPPWR